MSKLIINNCSIYKMRHSAPICEHCQGRTKHECNIYEIEKQVKNHKKMNKQIVYYID